LLYMTAMMLAYMRPRLKNIESALPDCVPDRVAASPQEDESLGGADLATLIER